MKNLMGLYEKALPLQMCWERKFEVIRELDFDFLEISIDESDQRLNRLFDHSIQNEIKTAMTNSAVPIKSMCLSAHRLFPFGSRDAKTRGKSLEIMKSAIEMSCELGIRVIQIAGYDVYYEKSDMDTRHEFIVNLRKAVQMAAEQQVVLAIEIMDTTFINSITKFLEIFDMIKSPWLAVYPDVGNLTAWGNDVEKELEKGLSHIVAVHLKEAKAVSPGCMGQFRDVKFGNGDVNFERILSKLRIMDFCGPFVLEMWAGPENDDLGELRSAKDFIDKCYQRAAEC